MRKDERTTREFHGLIDGLCDNAGRVFSMAAEFDTVEHGVVADKVLQGESLVARGTHRGCNLSNARCLEAFNDSAPRNAFCAHKASTGSIPEVPTFSAR